MKRMLCVLVGLALVASVPAELVDDFDSYDISSSTNVRDVASDNWTAIGNTGQADIFDDGTGNQVLAYGWSQNGRGCCNDNITAIADNTTGAVLFFNLYANKENLNHSFGLSDVSSSEISWFNDYEVQLAVQSNGDNSDGLVNLYFRNGGTGETTSISSSTWYNVWAVIDQVNDTYDVYLSTGEANIGTATLVAEDMSFRNAADGSVGDLTTIFAFAYQPGDEEDLWIDNVALTVPEPATMALLGFGLLAVRKRK